MRGDRSPRCRPHGAGNHGAVLRARFSESGTASPVHLPDDQRSQTAEGKRVKAARSQNLRRFLARGTEYKRLLEKDGKPLRRSRHSEEQAKLDREIEKQKHESESDRRKRQEKEHRELEDERQVRREVTQAYNFTLLGEEVVNGRSCWKIQAEPKPGYRPVHKDAKFLPKMHGTVWIDKDNYEWARVDAESLDTISAGLGLLRVGKGFRFLLEQQYVNNEIWAPVNIQIKATAKALFLVGGNFDVRISFKDYKKYSVNSTVTPAGEVTQ